MHWLKECERGKSGGRGSVISAGFAKDIEFWEEGHVSYGEGYCFGFGRGDIFCFDLCCPQRATENTQRATEIRMAMWPKANKNLLVDKNVCQEKETLAAVAGL